MYFNDVWASEDGKEWKSLSLEAPWCKRTSAAATVFNSKIFILGGVFEAWTGTMGALKNIKPSIEVLEHMENH